MLDPRLSDDYGSADLTWWEEAIAWVLAIVLLGGAGWLGWWLI